MDRWSNEALAGLYDSLAGDLLRFLAATVQDRDVAEDLLQETFLRLATQPLVVGTHARRLAFRIAANLARDHARRLSRIQRLLARWWRPEPHVSPALAGDERVARALERLAPRARAIVWLALVEEWPHREIAGAVGVSPGSVRVLLHRARERLRRDLELKE